MALGDATRRRIVEELGRGPPAVGELADLRAWLDELWTAALAGFARDADADRSAPPVGPAPALPWSVTHGGWEAHDDSAFARRGTTVAGRRCSRGSPTGWPEPQSCRPVCVEHTH